MLPDTVLKYKGKGENPQAPRKKKLVTYKGTNNRLFQTSLLQQQIPKTIL